jgi:hypothetical protein
MRALLEGILGNRHNKLMVSNPLKVSKIIKNNCPAQDTTSIFSREFV